HTRFSRDWSSDVCSSDLEIGADHRRETPYDGFAREMRTGLMEGVNEGHVDLVEGRAAEVASEIEGLGPQAGMQADERLRPLTLADRKSVVSGTRGGAVGR